MQNLPSLRFMMKPGFGFGIDARLRFGFGCNCFMAAESYLNGTSFVGFGLEPQKASWIRFQFVPTAKVILRLPIVRVSEFKYGYGGAEMTVFDKGSHPKLNFSSSKSFWNSIRQYIRPGFEIQHHNTILGTLFDDRQRRILKEAVREVTTRRKVELERLQENRNRVLKSFDPSELPPLDPRRGASELRKRIHERNRKRKLRIPGQSPVLLDELRDRGLFKKDEKGPRDVDRPADSFGTSTGVTQQSKRIILAAYGNRVWRS